MYLLKAVSTTAVDMVSGHGELWSAQILAAALAAVGKPFRFLDARLALQVSFPPSMGGGVEEGASPIVCWDVSSARMRGFLADEKWSLRVQGYAVEEDDDGEDGNSGGGAGGEEGSGGAVDPWAGGDEGGGEGGDAAGAASTTAPPPSSPRRRASSSSSSGAVPITDGVVVQTTPRTPRFIERMSPEQQVLPDLALAPPARPQQPPGRIRGRSTNPTLDSAIDADLAAAADAALALGGEGDGSEPLQDEPEGDPAAYKHKFVMTGFIAATEDGVMTTLKRDGSDFTASIAAKLLRAERVTIWTDVDGVLSADPRLVPGAHIVPHVTYHEAMELAYFGAKVIHPKTMIPAVDAKIPISIRNTFNPGFAGTEISGGLGPKARSFEGLQTRAQSMEKLADAGAGESGDNSGGGSGGGGTAAPLPLPPNEIACTTALGRAQQTLAVKGLSSVVKLALLNLEGMGMIGVPGVAQRLFGALERVGTNVLFIAQASSEQSICFGIPLSQMAAARESVLGAFFKEIHDGTINRVDCVHPVALIAAVGDGMINAVGMSGKFFSALSSSHINVLAISQGSSQRNISAVVMQDDAEAAVRALHVALCEDGGEGGAQ